MKIQFNAKQNLVKYCINTYSASRVSFVMLQYRKQTFAGFFWRCWMPFYILVSFNCKRRAHGVGFCPVNDLSWCVCVFSLPPCYSFVQPFVCQSRAAWRHGDSGRIWRSGCHCQRTGSCAVSPGRRLVAQKMIGFMSYGQ